MEQIKKLLASLSLRQRISILAVAVVVAAGLVTLSRVKHAGDFRPVFSAMAPEDAAAVVQKIREKGLEYKIAENGSAVLVPSAALAELRLELAAAGLPKNGRIGFELFDKTNFGATEFVEQINYRRALEGELERSVASLSEVEQARVHLTFPKDSVYLDSRQPAKASVMLKLRPGARITQKNTAAICHLVASAVEGLTPETVSVMDMDGNLLNRPKKPGMDDEEPSEEMLDFQRKIERYLSAKVEETLEPVLGPGRFRARAAVECDFTSGEQSEEVFDPERSVMLTSQKSEDGGIITTSAGVPGTASNLPRPAPRAAGANGITKRTESITYQSSRTVRRTRVPQGTIKRISVSVLVDHLSRWEGQGNQRKRVVVAPSPEMMASIRQLAAGAAGIKPDRGDQLIVEALPFESTVNVEQPAAQGPPQAPSSVPGWVAELQKNPKMLLLAGIAVAAILFLAGGLAILMLRKRSKQVDITVPAALPPAEEGAEPGQLPATETAGEIAAEEQPALPPPPPNPLETLVQSIREMVAQDPAVCAGVIREWLRQ